MKGIRRMTELERFEYYIFYSPDGCWYWTGGLTNGYGMFRYDWKTTKAHRRSYELYKGKIPAGLVVMHTCDNPSCVNPYHLQPGTFADNNRDRKIKGRNRDQRGTKHNNVKLNDVAIQIIKEALQLGYKLQPVANYFKISYQHVSAIKLGKRWKHKLTC